MKVLSASKSGHWDCVRTLIESGADVTCADNDGYTVLHWVAKHGQVEIAEIVRGLAPDEVNRTRQTKKYGWTPLHQAAAEGRARMCRWLVVNGMDTSICNKGGQTATVVAQKVCPMGLNEGRTKVSHAVRSLDVTSQVGAIKHQTTEAASLLTKLDPLNEAHAPGQVLKELTSIFGEKVSPPTVAPTALVYPLYLGGKGFTDDGGDEGVATDDDNSEKNSEKLWERLEAQIQDAESVTSAIDTSNLGLGTCNEIVDKDVVLVDEVHVQHDDDEDEDAKLEAWLKEKKKKKRAQNRMSASSVPLAEQF